MKVHHINCGAMQPYGGALFDGQTPGLAPATMSCHCLLLETDAGLVLVDTGTVSRDGGGERIAAVFRISNRVRLDPAEAAVSQVSALRHRPEDVRHVVMTHMDFDHAAGLIDLPGATVHLSAREAAAARTSSGPIGANRYSAAQWGTARWNTYNAFPTAWFGLPAAPVDGVPGVLLVSLPGHTEGHCGVAVQIEGGWLLHAGDTFMHHRQIHPTRPSTPTAARAYQWMMQTSFRQRRHSLAEVQRLHRDHSAEIGIICTHDPSQPPPV